ncbi:MAG: hypothetical protein WC490_00495 [Candidatus Margulisiibacteriota bacterium]
MKNFQFPISNFQLQIDKVWRALLLAFCFALIVLEFGCARTVTVLPDAGNQLQLEITFRGEIDPSVNKYYLVLSGSSVLLPYTGTYFFGPGEAYDTDKLNVSTDLSYYYANYYSTWNDFILLKDSSFLITNGAFTSSTLHTTYTPSLLIFRTIPSGDPDALKKINLTLFFNRLSTLPSTLYFNFISADKDGYMRDYLRSTDNSISTNTGSAISEKRETEDPSIDGGLDIISWNMVVQ